MAETAEKRTRRSNGEGAIRQRADGRWESKFTRPDGTRASAYGKTRSEALARRDDALKDARSGVDSRKARQTLREYLGYWYEEVASPRCKAKTLRSYRQLLDVHIIPKLGSIELRNLTVDHVTRFLNERHKRGLSARSTNHLRAVLRNALSEAVRLGYVERNVASLAKPIRQAQTPAAYLTAEQARRLIEATKDAPHGPLFALAIFTGLRQGELLALRWSDVVLQDATDKEPANGVLHVRQTVQRINREWLFTEPKSTTSRRTLPLPAPAVDVLRTQETRCAELRDAAGARWQNYELVFPSTVGGPLEGTNIVKRLQAALDSAGLPKVTFHALRHSCASMLLSQGVPARVVQEVLGHSSIALTLGTYSHVAPVMLQDAADAMTRALNPA